MTSHAEQDDATLASLARSGELRAFDELARRHQPGLMRFVRRRFPGSEAEDVCQEALVKAYRRLNQYRAKYAFKSWLYSIAYHEIIDRCRQRERQTRPLRESLAQLDPTEAAMAADQKATLWSIAERVLTESQYTALWLVYAEQLTAGETARVMKRSTISVKVMVHRARKVLALHLDRESYVDSRSLE